MFSFVVAVVVLLFFAPEESNARVVGGNLTIEYGKHKLTFIRAPMDFYQATEACESQGLSLALPRDMEWAYTKGFHSCSLGWLASMRMAYSQFSEKEDKCVTKLTGVIYKRGVHSHDRAGGAYCTSRQYFKPAAYNEKNKRVYNIWMRYHLSAVFQLREDLKRSFKKSIIRNINALYPCCNIFSIRHIHDENDDVRTGVFIKKTREDMSEFQHLLNKYFPESRPKLMPHLHISYAAMIHYKAGTDNRTATINELVDKVVSTGWDGLIVNYEPATDFSKGHAMITARFLDELTEKMHEHGKQVGFCISDWGILKYWKIYARTRVDFFPTMSMTYYGSNVHRNKKRVKSAMKKIGADRVQVGIKSKMYEPTNPSVSSKQPRSAYDKPSGWKYRGLHDFVRFIHRTPIEQVHIWPESFGHRSRTAIFFYEVIGALADKR